MSIEEFKLGLGKRLRNYLTELKISQKEFAEQTGLSTSAVSSLVRGKSGPSAEILFHLTEVYPELNMNWFLKGSGGMTVNSGNLVIGDRNNFIAEGERSLRAELLLAKQEIEGLKKQLELKDKIIALLEAKK